MDISSVLLCVFILCVSSVVKFTMLPDLPFLSKTTVLIRYPAFFYILILLPAYAFPQQYDPLHPPNTYRNKDNPYYWKNRKPYPGYWQQDTYYKINASLDDSTDIVTGKEALTYWNNSPDTLHYVYFHLYQNAFQPGSYYDNLYRSNKVKPTYGHYEKQKLGTTVSQMEVNGQELKTELDNTILKVYLNHPLLSGQSITFHISFKTYFDHGSIRRRMKMFNDFGYKHYDLVHWYPRIAVYDRKFGWDTEQHMAHEFYGDFGAYDVSITLPNNYIAGATGNLLNRKEVLPDTLRKKLDISNLKNKPWDSPPSVIIKPNGTTKTWKYHAENVIDFALTADPTYRIGEYNWNGIKCIALVQEPHAAGWQNAAEYAAKVIETNSKYIGMYGYPKIIVADAKDGMEYPMMTLDGGFDPNYRSLFTHEISHNWFFGMVGTNETYRPELDEGFTQFLTAFDYQIINGKYRVENPPTSKYIRKFRYPDDVRNSEVYDGYLYYTISGEKATLNTSSDDFHGALGHGGGYSQVYFKTATMLYNLQYVLGDTLFQKAMQHYFKQWKFCHPYWEDFRNSIIQYTHVDLNWFFDEWITTTKTIDYGIRSVKRGKLKDQYVITFVRKGGMQMPIDFEVISDADSAFHFYIPNTWFVKKTNAKVLPRWIGWGPKLETKYQATVTIPGGLSNVIIDPSHRLADINMLNNSYQFPLQSAFDSKVYNPPDWTKYQLLYGPSIWYNGYDGAKIGIHMKGNYLYRKDVVDAHLWINTGIAQTNLDSIGDMNHFDNVAFHLNYETATDNFIPHSGLHLSGGVMDGLNSANVGFYKMYHGDRNKFFVKLKAIYRPHQYDVKYLLNPMEWQAKKFNNAATLGWKHHYSYHKGSTGDITLSLKSSFLTNDYNYSFLTMNAINKNHLGKIRINTRLFMQYGSGTQIPYESALYTAGDNPEGLMDNKFTRAQGIIQPQWASYSTTSTNYFQDGGGLNLRGYAGFLIPETDANGHTVYLYKGNSGASFNTELEFNRLIKFNPSFLKNTFKITTYLFGDAGVINKNMPGQTLDISNVIADGGVGATLTIARWGPLQMADPLTLRFDMPLYLSQPPAGESTYQYRWVFGIGRTF